MVNSTRQPRHETKNLATEYLQFTLFVLCFATGAISLHLQQWLGTPLLYLSNRKWYDAWQAVVKRWTAVLVLGLNQWRSPVTAEISSDLSIAGQIRKTSDGRTVFDFPKRIVLIANHQLYTDWISLWWTAYTGGHHDALIIVLKDAIKKIPILGHGMVFFSWIFLSRNWEADKARLDLSISRLADRTKQTPMWLLVFPEGTNISKRSMAISRKWAEKNDLVQFENALLPRSRGLQVILQGLASSVDWLYDCTVAYEDIPPGKDGQDIFNLRSLYIEARKAPVTHVHWRRFAIKEMPLNDSVAFDNWLYERWAEKDKLLKQFRSHGHFPTADAYIQASVGLESRAELLPVLTCLITVPVAWWLVEYLYKVVASLYGLMRLV